MTYTNFTGIPKDIIGGILPGNIKIRKQVNSWFRYRFTIKIARKIYIRDRSRNEIYTLSDLNQIFNN